MKNPFWFALNALWWWFWEYFDNPIGHPYSEHYLVHGQWRVQLVRRRIVHWWKNIGNASKDTHQGLWRMFWVLVAGFVSFYIATGAVTGKWGLLDWCSSNIFTWLHEQSNLKGSTTNNGFWSLLTLLMGAPIAFAIWAFRDQNNRQQIENQRKDINLKDFQKLAEWASGLHLVEDKVTTSEKITGKETSTIERNRNVETWDIPQGITLQSPNRREGSASLQIAAVTQLKAFLEGGFGKHFQKPAFILLTAIQLAIIKKQPKKEKSIHDLLNNQTKELEDGDPLDIALKKEVQTVFNKSPILKIITETIIGEYGNTLRRHHDQLPGLVLTGLDTRLSNVGRLCLDGLKLTAIQLQGAYLGFAELQGASLAYGNLHGANLIFSRLQEADLSGSEFHGANLSRAQLQGAHLMFAKLQNTNLYFSHLENANLNHAQFNDSDLRHTSLQNIQLHGAIGVNFIVNKCTNFSYSQCDEKTRIEITKNIFNETILPLLTHAARLKLREQNGLVLPDFRYTEYKEAWDNATQSQRDQAMELACTRTTYQGDPT